MISINEHVMPSVKHLIEHAEQLGCRSFRLPSGAHVIDMGIHVPGGWEAARLFTEIDIACLGRVSYRDYSLASGIHVPAVEVYADNPHLGCLLSQIAGWKLTDGEFAAIGSGPARALAVDPDDHCFDLHPYRDSADSAVLGLQMTELPDDALALKAAEACRVDPEHLYLLVHASTSLTASVQVSARIIEQTINKMIKKSFDLDQILFARGLCLVAPVCDDELEAMGRINDSLLYGGFSCFQVRSDDDQISRVIGELVTESSRDYGRLFKDLFLEAGKNFYNMDLDIHSPAQVQIYNINSGNLFTAGRIREDIIEASYFGRSNAR